MNFYPFHIGDYISHTSHLTDAEDLAYRRMMDLYYLSEEAFSSVEYVARRVKSTVEVVAVLLDEFFEKDENGLWRNSRADEEIAKYRAKAESARNANRVKSEKKSNLKTDSNKELKSEMKSELISEPNHNVTKNQEPRTINQDIKPKKAAPSVDPVFEEIWKAYPKRPGASKADTLKAFQARIKSGVVPNIMLEGAKQYAKYCEVSGIDANYIKQPATFFGPNEHYLSDWTPPKASATTKDLPLGTDAQIEHAYRVECGGDPTQARFASYPDMRKFILNHRDKRRASV